MFEDIIAAIMDGGQDENLDQIIAAAKDRREQVASRLRYTLKQGDRVKVVGDLRPAYLIGLIGIVKKINQKTISLDFEDTVAARRYARGVRMPMEFVAKVDTDYPKDW